MSENCDSPSPNTATTVAAADTPPSRSVVWCAVVAAFFLIYVLIYPLVPLALKSSGLGNMLPDWMETGFKISAAPLGVAHERLPIYRSYVEFLDGVMQSG